MDDNKTIIFWQAFIEIHQNLVPAKWDYINRPEPLSLSMHVALASQVALLYNSSLINPSLEQEIQWIYIINEVKHHNYKKIY